MFVITGFNMTEKLIFNCIIVFILITYSYTNSKLQFLIQIYPEKQHSGSLSGIFNSWKSWKLSVGDADYIL